MSVMISMAACMVILLFRQLLVINTTRSPRVQEKPLTTVSNMLFELIDEPNMRQEDGLWERDSRATRAIPSPRNIDSSMERLTVLHGQLTLLNQETPALTLLLLHYVSRAPYSFDIGLNSLKTS
jgi:hypothetical protein